MNEALENILRIKYLLGQTTKEESLQVEESYFQSPDYHESMLAMEEELIRQFLNHELSPEQHARFETHFLATARRQKKFETTRDLIQYLKEAHPVVVEQAVAAPSVFQRAIAGLQALPALLVWNARIAIVALTLLLIAGAWFYVSLKRNHQSESIAQSSQVNIFDPSLQGRETNLAVNPNDSETAKLDESRGRASGQSHQSIHRTTAPRQKQARNALGMVINLPAFRNISDKVIELPIPAKTKQIRLNIPLEEAEYGKYKIIVKDTDGLEIVRHSDIKPIRSESQWKLIFPLPADRLTRTEYVINLYGILENNEEKLISEGFFLPRFQEKP